MNEMTYTRNELVTELSASLNVSAHRAHAIVDKTLECLTAAFKREDKVLFRGFGQFVVKHYRPKMGRNPKKPDVLVSIPARKVVRFKMGKELKQSLNA